MFNGSYLFVEQVLVFNGSYLFMEQLLLFNGFIISRRSSHTKPRRLRQTELDLGTN